MSQEQEDFSKQHSVRQLYDALGSIMEYMNLDDVYEIMINGPDMIFMERAGVVTRVDAKISDVQIRTAIQIVARADGSTRDVAENSKNVIIGARLPGYRIAATMKPVSVRGNSMAIRKHNPKNLTVADYVAAGVMGQAQADFLVGSVKSHENIIVAGGTSSGKTTLLNALIREIDQEERILTVEDTQELKVANENWIAFEANEQNEVTIRTLVKQALRYRPDRIIVGEVRGGEAFDLMQAANTGHDGTFATLHANSAFDALNRLETMILASGVPWPHQAIQKNIGTTFDLVIHMERHRGVRRLSQILRIEGYDDNQGGYLTKPIFVRKE